MLNNAMGQPAKRTSAFPISSSLCISNLASSSHESSPSCRICYLHLISLGNSLSLGPAKVNKIKIFLGPYFKIKHVLTFVSGFQESVLVDFMSQNKVKILYEVKTGQNFLH